MIFHILNKFESLSPIFKHFFLLCPIQIDCCRLRIEISNEGCSPIEIPSRWDEIEGRIDHHLIDQRVKCKRIGIELES